MPINLFLKFHEITPFLHARSQIKTTQEIQCMHRTFNKLTSRDTVNKHACQVVEASRCSGETLKRMSALQQVVRDTNRS